MRSRVLRLWWSREFGFTVVFISIIPPIVFHAPPNLTSPPSTSSRRKPGSFSRKRKSRGRRCDGGSWQSSTSSNVERKNSYIFLSHAIWFRVGEWTTGGKIRCPSVRPSITEQEEETVSVCGSGKYKPTTREREEEKMVFRFAGRRHGLDRRWLIPLSSPSFLVQSPRSAHDDDDDDVIIFQWKSRSSGSRRLPGSFHFNFSFARVYRAECGNSRFEKEK